MLWTYSGSIMLIISLEDDKLQLMQNLVGGGLKGGGVRERGVMGHGGGVLLRIRGCLTHTEGGRR